MRACDAALLPFAQRVQYLSHSGSSPHWTLRKQLSNGDGGEGMPGAIIAYDLSARQSHGVRQLLSVPRPRA